MKWRGQPGSANVEDRRGMGGKVAIGGGATIIIMIVAALLGADPGVVLDTLGNGNPGVSTPYVETAEDKELADFVSVVLADTETVWTGIFSDLGSEYPEPTLVLYTDSVESACGVAGSSTGPFYCPADGNLYIDLSFFRELRDRFQAPGDFAMAYVVAHEVGHHVQTQLGVTAQLQELRQQLGQEEYNEYSVRFELQADYLAGVWASHAQGRGLLEEGDLEEALTAANAIGDDRIQRETQGYVVPDSFTHGTSAQRMRWFRRGFDTGNLDGWDTFSATQL
ncbi:MAG: neutral zinc metallopeptidase [Coriobacteriia bacterium]|nr:neutral zinc metallopeptidase [Coriobacteriia bacterium]